MGRRGVQDAYKTRECPPTWKKELIIKRGDKLEDNIKMDLKEAGWEYLYFNSCNSG